MTDLNEFLSLQDVNDITHDVEIKRLGKFTVRPMNHEQFSAYQKRARDKGTKGYEFDSGKLNMLIVTGQMVSPDFSNAEFLAKAACATASDFIKKKFKAGEIAELASKITDISGFDVDFDEKVTEAKN